MDMAALLTETLTRISAVTDSSFQSSVQRALAQMDPTKLMELAKSLSSANDSPLSPGTSKTPLHVTPVLHALEEEPKSVFETPTPETKKPQDLEDLGVLSKWRLHGDSNPGYIREREVS